MQMSHLWPRGTVENEDDLGVRTLKYTIDALLDWPSDLI
jgi:hypothetical protein